jgi:hypothetical protein
VADGGVVLLGHGAHSAATRAALWAIAAAM